MTMTSSPADRGLALPLVRATTAAEEALSRVRHEYGPVILLLPAGTGASTPMCLPASDLTIGEADIMLATIAGCPVFMPRRQLRAWPHREVLLDVEPGLPDGFSLPAGDGRHFVAWLSSTPLLGVVRD